MCNGEVGITGWTLCNQDKLKRNLCYASDFGIREDCVSTWSLCIGKNKYKLCSKIQCQINGQFHTMQFLMHRMRMTEPRNAHQAYTFMRRKCWDMYMKVVKVEDTGCYSTRVAMKHISDVIAAEFIVIKLAISICFHIIDTDFSGYQ